VEHVHSVIYNRNKANNKMKNVDGEIKEKTRTKKGDFSNRTIHMNNNTRCVIHYPEWPFFP